MKESIHELKIKDKTSLSENIKISRFKSTIRKTSPHKHNNYFEIIYLSDGSGIHTIDMQEFPIEPPVLFIIRKDQVHFWEIDSEPAGYVLIVKKSFLDESLDKEIKLLFSKLSAYSCLSPSDSNTVEQLFWFLNNEFPKKNFGQTLIIEGLLKALLAKMMQSEKPGMAMNPGKENLFESFRELLSQDHHLTNKVSHYADLLNTSPQNLNAVCRKEIDLPAAKVISDFIINEAKRLLLYTSLRVTDISFALNFKDNSHFTKYFKKHTGITPVAYRHLSK